MDWILFDQPETVVSRVDRPIVGSQFLLPRIVVLVGFEIHLPYLFGFWHVLSGVDSLLCSPLVGFSGQSKLEIVLLGLLGIVVVAVYGFGKGFPT